MMQLTEVVTDPNWWRSEPSRADAQHLIFEKLSRGTGVVKWVEVRKLAQISPTGSLGMYAIESLGLAVFSVVGAQSGIVRGLHPLASSCLGVTIAAGGPPCVCVKQPHRNSMHHLC